MTSHSKIAQFNCECIGRLRSRHILTPHTRQRMVLPTKRVVTHVITQEILLYLTVIYSDLPTYSPVTESGYRLSDTMECCNTGVLLVRDAPLCADWGSSKVFGAQTAARRQ